MESSDEELVFITCDVCDLPFTGIEPFEQHLKGKKHQREMKIKGRKRQVKSLGDGGGTLGSEETEDAEVQDFTCDICETSFSGIIPYTQHLRSKPHAKVLRRKKAEEDPTRFDKENSDSELPDDEADLNDMVKEIVPEPFGSCSICEKQFSGPESYYQHMKCKSHSKRKFELRLLRRIEVELNKSKGFPGISGSGELGEDEEPQLAQQDFAIAGKDEVLECRECNKVFSGAVTFAQHLTSKAHEKRRCQNELLEQLKIIKALELEDNSTESEDQQSGEGQRGIFPSVDPVLTCDICNMAFSGPESAKAHLKSKGHQKAIRWKNYLAQRYQLVKQDQNGPKNDTEDDKAKEKDSPVDTASTSAAVYDSKPSAPAFPQYAEECPSYDQSQDQLPGGDVCLEDTRDLGSAGENKKSESLYPSLPDDDDQTEKKTTPSGDSANSESDSSESESAITEDEKSSQSNDAGVAVRSKEANEGDDSSPSGIHLGKKKKSKTAKCKSGMGKLVTTVAKIFD